MSGRLLSMACVELRHPGQYGQARAGPVFRAAQRARQDDVHAIRLRQGGLESALVKCVCEVCLSAHFHCQATLCMQPAHAASACSLPCRHFGAPLLTPASTPYDMHLHAVLPQGGDGQHVVKLVDASQLEGEG